MFSTIFAFHSLHNDSIHKIFYLFYTLYNFIYFIYNIFTFCRNGHFYLFKCDTASFFQADLLQVSVGTVKMFGLRMDFERVGH